MNLLHVSILFLLILTLKNHLLFGISTITLCVGTVLHYNKLVNELADIETTIPHFGECGDFKHCYQSAGYVVTRDVKSITEFRIRYIFCKIPKYKFPSPINSTKCREEIAGTLQEFCNHWCKREHVESNAINTWKLNIFLILLMKEFQFIAIN